MKVGRDANVKGREAKSWMDESDLYSSGTENDGRWWDGWG